MMPFSRAKIDGPSGSGVDQGADNENGGLHIAEIECWQVNDIEDSTTARDTEFCSGKFTPYIMASSHPQTMFGRLMCSFA